MGILLFTVIGPLIAFKFVRTSMILGSIFSIAQGYALAIVCHVVVGKFLYPMALAFALSFSVIELYLKVLNLILSFTQIEK